jgi:hypothetical protein
LAVSKTQSRQKGGNRSTGKAGTAARVSSSRAMSMSPQPSGGVGDKGRA